MVKKSASFVLTALEGSTYGTEYAFASSLAAASLDGLFDHPASVNRHFGPAGIPKGISAAC
jgi:hypothetical protein